MSYAGAVPHESFLYLWGTQQTLVLMEALKFMSVSIWTAWKTSVNHTREHINSCLHMCVYLQVSEQTDTLRVLRTDPVDYLVTPRVIACCVALPILTTMCFAVAMAASVLLADSVYNVSANIILESAARALQPWDLISTTIKSVVFGGIISIVSCTWGVTTLGGAKGVGESTTSAVVISLVCIFIADFILSWVFFQGAGDALKAAMG